MIGFYTFARRLTVFSLGAGLLFSVPGAIAKPFTPTIQQPTSYQEFKDGIAETRANIATVDCGGFDPNSSGKVSGTKVNGDVPIPTISNDVPGRENSDPLAKPETGLGERGGFQYPDSAFGYLSACDMGQKAITDQDLVDLGIPGIKWDWSGDADDPVTFLPDPGNPGRIEINPYGWCNPIKGATPRLCEKLFKALKDLAHAVPRPPSAPNALCPCPADAVPGSCPTPKVDKHYCFDTEVIGTTRPELTKTCTGQECRTTWGPDFSNSLLRCEWGIPQYDADGNYIGQIPKSVSPDSESWMTSSFYRHYGNPFSDWTQTRSPSQSPLTVSSPGQTWKLRADCYQQYIEVDPKDTVGVPLQCEIVILTDDDQQPVLPEWQPKTKQKAETKGIAKNPPSPSRVVPDPWVADPETNLSLIDMVKLKTLQTGQSDPTDITSILSTILETKLQASDTVSPHARTDTFSEDDHRAFGKFWESQQKELWKMVEDPTTKLVLPARFFVGLSDKDPLYQYVRGIVSRSDGTLEVTLHAGGEDIQNVLQSFMRVYVGPLQEVRIPLLVPLVSDTEIATRLFEWEQWKIYEDRASTAENRPSKSALADPLILKLQNYQVAAQNVRALRSALIAHLSKVFVPQTKIRSFVADWYKQNSALLQQVAQKSVQRRDLKAVWREAQDIMLQTDESQLLWCGNQRYSVPIYSLLDTPIWWGDQPPWTARNHAFVPTDDLTTLGYTQPKDQLYDFSTMKFTREPLRIPVLWPIEVAVRLPTPPLVGVDPPDPSSFPDLPPVPSPSIIDSFPVPNVDTPPPPLITAEPLDDLSQAITIMQSWKQRMELMKMAYELFQKSVKIPPDPEQKVGKSEKIIHVENDLKERIARLFSRWMPERKEDLAGRVVRLKLDGFTEAYDRCKEDIVCMFLPSEKTVTADAQWYVPASTLDATALGDTLKQWTLPQKGTNDPNALNPYEAPIDVLERLFLPLPLPVSIDLIHS